MARLIVLALVLSPFAFASASSGQANSAAPEAGSPSGTIYEIPLDTGRRDAAPHRRGGSRGARDQSGGPAGGGPGPGGGGGTGGGDTSIKSENGFGSSSHVPGLKRKRRSKGVGGAREAAESAARAAATPTSASDSNPSSLGTYGLIALIVAVAGCAGFLAARAVRRSPE